MFYQGPTINPAVEVNIACGGRLLSDAGRAVDDVLAEVVELLYRPKDAFARQQLVELFLQVENTYFDHWSDERIIASSERPPPGEQLIGPLFGTTPGRPIYLSEPYLDEHGRQAFKESLLSAYDELSKIERRFTDQGRVQRIKKCIIGTVSDIETLASARG